MQEIKMSYDQLEENELRSLAGSRERLLIKTWVDVSIERIFYTFQMFMRLIGPSQGLETENYTYKSI